MRAGKLKTRRYKIHRGRKIFGFVLVAAALLAAGYAWRSGRISLPLALTPAPTALPQEKETESRTLTLPGGTWYALQLGLYEKSEGAARQTAELFQGRGAGGYLYSRDGYRVLAAAYENRADAQTVQTRLRTQYSIETYLLEIARPEITLRLTGQKGQLSALSDAYAFLEQAAGQLSAQSQRLDNGSAGKQEILSFLASLQETADALESRMDALFGASALDAVKQIRAALGDLSRALAQAQEAQSVTALGAQVKYCQLMCIARMAEYAESLSR